MKADMIVKSGLKFLEKKAPEILIGFTVVGVFGTAISAVKHTPAAQEHLRQARELKGGELTLGEKIKATWKDYAIPTAKGVITSACAIGAAVIYRKRIAGLAALLAVTQQAFSEYKDNAEKLLAEKSIDVKELENKIEDSKIEKDLEQNGGHLPKLLPTKESIADRLCKDVVTGQYFYSTYDKIKDKARAIQSGIDQYDADYTYEDWASMIGLEKVPWGSSVVFNSDNPFSVKITSKLIDDTEVLMVKVLNAL